MNMQQHPAANKPMSSLFNETVWAGIAAWAGAFTAAATIWALILTDKASDDAKDAQLERFKKQAGVDIASANARAEEAKKDASFARLEAEKLKALVAWRAITPETRDKFKVLTKDLQKGRVTVESLSGNPEAINFGSQIADMLSFAGYDAVKDLGRIIQIGAALGGLEMTVRSAEEPPPFAGPLQRALESIEVEARGVVNPRAGDGVIITVAAKP